MCGLLNVQVEVWPVAADETGLWLLSGRGPALSSPIPQDSDAHFEVENLLIDVSPQPPVLVHSTCWRPDGPHIILTYVAVFDADDVPVPQSWPDALPVSVALLEAVGNPPTNAANDAPAPRDVDVLAHGIRHLSFLREHDATAAAALPAAWERHLDQFRPALAGLYSVAHAA